MNEWPNQPSSPPPLLPDSSPPSSQDPLSFLPPLGSTGSSLGNLADSVRKKSLRNARGALILAGVLQLLQAGLESVSAESQAEKALREQVRQMYGGNAQIDSVKFNEAKAAIVRFVYMFSAGLVVVGVVFFGLAAIVLKYPAGATIAGMTIYLGSMAGMAVLNPLTLISGLIWKIVVIASLYSGIKAGVALQKKQKEDEAARMNAAFPPPPTSFSPRM